MRVTTAKEIFRRATRLEPRFARPRYAGPGGHPPPPPSLARESNAGSGLGVHVAREAHAGQALEHAGVRGKIAPRGQHVQ